MRPVCLKQSAPNKCEKEVGKNKEDIPQQDIMSGEFKKSEKEHNITEKAVKTNKKDMMGKKFKLKPLPDIPLRGTVTYSMRRLQHVHDVPRF